MSARPRGVSERGRRRLSPHRPGNLPPVGPALVRGVAMAGGPKVAIIGGGPGGLMTAYFLQQRANVPYRATIFEAGDRLGGKIHTARFDRAPITYEAGAAELYDYSAVGPDPLRELVAEL